MKTKKNLMIGVLALSLILASTTAVLADAETPGSPGWGMGTPIKASLDNYVIPLIAEQLGLSEDEVSSALNSGGSFADLALAAGYGPEEIPALLESIHAQALELSLQDGAITQEQAEWLQNVRFGANGRGRMSGNPDAPRLYLSTGASMRRGGRR